MSITLPPVILKHAAEPHLLRQLAYPTEDVSRQANTDPEPKGDLPLCRQTPEDVNERKEADVSLSGSCWCGSAAPRL